MVDYKHWLCQEWEVFQTDTQTKHHSRIIFQVSHLKDCNFYTEYSAHSKRCRQCSHFSRNTVREENSRALLLGWEDESVLSSKANPGCILTETGCAQICCVLGFHYSSLQTHPQLPANTGPHPRCSSTVWLPLVLSAQEPYPVIYYLAVFCITWVHTASHTVAPVTSYLAIFVILCKAVPVRCHLLCIHQRTL